MDKEFLTPQEVAELLGVSRRTITNWIKTGKLPALKIGRTVRIKREALLALSEPPKERAA